MSVWTRSASGGGASPPPGRTGPTTCPGPAGPRGTPRADGARPGGEEGALRRIAFAAATALRLEIFGGDVAVPDPHHPVLIDINDWPSFAPFRAEAAQAIGDYVAERIANRPRTHAP